jgi:hypothetical protein
MCMYAYVYVRVCVFMCMHAYVYVCVCVYMRMCMYAYVYVCVCVCMRMCMYVYICGCMYRMRMCACVSTRTNVGVARQNPASVHYARGIAQHFRRHLVSMSGHRSSKRVSI